MHKGLVSIIIPCFNYGQYLAECLTSVINQTYENMEIIILDDGSTDDSSQIANEFAKNDKRINYFWQANKGYPSIHNKGLDLAKGEFIIYLDADDMLGDKSSIKILASYLKMKSNMAFAFGLTQRIDVRGNCISGPYGNKISGYLMPFLLKKDFIPLGSMMFNRNIAQNIRFDNRVPFMQDYLFKLRVASTGVGSFVDVLALKYRIHSGSVSKDQRRIREDTLKCLYYAKEELFGYADKRTWAIAFSRAYFNLAKEEELRQDLRKAKHFYLRSIQEYLFNWKASILGFGAILGGVLKYMKRIKNISKLID